MSTPIQDSAPQDSAPEGRRDKVMAVFDKLGKLDQLGVVCVGLFVVSLVPSIVGIIALVIGAVLIALGGPKRRRVVLGVPRFIWYFGLSIYENWRHGEAEATRRHNRRMERSERRAEERAQREAAEIQRRLQEEMTREEFDQLLIDVEKELEADGTPRHEIELTLTHAEEQFEEALLRRELVERRREARERRRAGIAVPGEGEMDDFDRELMNRMGSDMAARADRDEENARERARRERQEEYEDLLAREEADIRREERQSREEERREREEDRRVREEERRAREEEREERRRNR